MKMSRSRYDELLAGFQVVIDHYGLDLIRQEYAKNYTRASWAILNIISDNKKFDDNHPMFASGRAARLIPISPGWDLYENGLNDSHIETAIKKISKHFGL